MPSTIPAVLRRVITTAIRGAFVADAASMGTHWIYNPVDVLEKVDDKEKPEFKDPPTPDFYSSDEFPNHYLSGMLSPFGEQLLFTTQFIADGDFTGASMSSAMYEWATTFGGRQDQATITFVGNMKSDDISKKYPNCGADDHQSHVFMKIVPVTCRYVDLENQSNPRLIQKVEEIIRVHQNDDTAVAFGIASSRILEAVILSASTSPPSKGSSLLRILDMCYDTVRSDLETVLGSGKSKVVDLVLESYKRGKTAAMEYATLDELLLKLSNESMKDGPDNPYYNLWARSCDLPGAFIGPMYQLYKIASLKSEAIIDESTFVDAIRENIFAAGDTCGRGVFLGAVLGAAMTHPETDTGTSAAGDIKTTTFESWWEKIESNTRNEIQSAANMIAEKQQLGAATSPDPKQELLKRKRSPEEGTV